MDAFGLGIFRDAITTSLSCLAIAPATMLRRAPLQLPLLSTPTFIQPRETRAARTSTNAGARHPAATPRQLPGTDEYREELRRRRRTWIKELEQLQIEREEESAKRNEARQERLKKEEADREAFLAQSNRSISNFEEYGISHVPRASDGKSNPLLKDIIAALDKEEGRLVKEAPKSVQNELVAGLKDASTGSTDTGSKSTSEQKPAATDRDPLIAQRRAMWARYIKLRRQHRFSNYLSTERSNSDSRLADLLRLYHASENFVTRENIESKIDVFLGEKGHPARQDTYRTATLIPSRDPVQLAMEIKEERRKRALEDAVAGTMSVDVGGGNKIKVDGLEQVRARIQGKNKLVE